MPTTTIPATTKPTPSPDLPTPTDTPTPAATEAATTPPTAAVARTTADATRATGRAAGEAEDRLWSALRANPGSTATELATLAQTAPSTTRKLLAAWATDGSVTSEPGAKPRDARRWTAAPTDLVPAALNAVPADSTDPAPVATAAMAAVDAAATNDVPDHDADPRVDNEAPAEPDVEPDVEDQAGAEEFPGAGGECKEFEKADSVTGSAKRAEPMRRNRSGSTRLPKGALRGQVEDYLLEHAGDHSPVEIGQALGRSSGAAANALETLVELGDAVQTSERPKRYSHAEHDDSEADAASTGPNGR